MCCMNGSSVAVTVLYEQCPIKPLHSHCVTDGCTLSHSGTFHCLFMKDKEEVTSPGGESDSNSTTTTPKTVISNQSSLPHHSPTPSLGSETSLGGSDRDRPATPKPTPWLPRSVTPVSWLHCCTSHCSVAVCSAIQDLSLSYVPAWFSLIQID